MLVGHQYRTLARSGLLGGHVIISGPRTPRGIRSCNLESRQRAWLHGIRQEAPIETCALQIDRLTVRGNETRRERGSSTPRAAPRRTYIIGTRETRDDRATTQKEFLVPNSLFGSTDFRGLQIKKTIDRHLCF